MEESVKPKKLIVLLGILIPIISVMLLSIGWKYELSVVSPSKHFPSLWNYSSRIIIWLGLLLTWLYSKKVEKQAFQLWERRKYSVGIWIVSLLAILLVIIAVVGDAAMVYKGLGWDTEREKITKAIQIILGDWMLILFTCITAGVTEELVVRAYMMPRIEQITGSAFLSVAISALLFGFMHIGYGTSFQVVATTLMGAVFGFYYYFYRNIRLLILFHFLWDLVILIIQKYSH
jgi:uncharacterized protein